MWFARCGFSSQKSAAECLGVGATLFRDWWYGKNKPSAAVRRLMQYVERFGKWEQIQQVPEGKIKVWLAGLPESADTAAKKAQSENMRTLRLRRTQAKP